MKQVGIVSLVLVAGALVGCESMGTAAQSKTVQGAALGTALGAATGAIVGNQSDHPGAGTAIGAGLGAIAGGLLGHAMEERSTTTTTQTTTTPATARTKFCPVGGEIYSEDVKYCPNHGVELRYKE